MAWEKLDTDRIEQIIRQITGKKIDKSKEMVSPAIIKGLWSRLSMGSHQKRPY